MYLMIRQTITLGNYTYLVDLYKASSDMNSFHYESFVMLKQFEIINGIMYDRDVYFISKSIIDECSTNDTLDINKLSEKIAYPITINNSTTSFSSNYKSYNPSYIKETFKFGNDIIRIYDETLENDAQILCDKLKIWFPITRGHINSIIHVSNIINDIRFHYLCNRSDIYEINSETEMSYNNMKYSEFIEVYVPNIESLFSKGRNFVREMFNTSYIKEKCEKIVGKNEKVTLYPVTNYTKEGDAIVKMLGLTGEFSSVMDEYDVLIYVNGNNACETSDEPKIVKSKYGTLSLDKKIKINEDDEVSLVCMKDGRELFTYAVHTNDIQMKDNEVYCSTFLMVMPFFIDKNVLNILNIDPNAVSLDDMPKIYFNTGADSLMELILPNPYVVTVSPFTEVNTTTKIYSLDDDMKENADVFTLSKDIRMLASFKFYDGKDETEPDMSKLGSIILNCRFYHSNELGDINLNDYYLKKTGLTIEEYRDIDLSDTDFDETMFPENIDKCGYVIEISNSMIFKEIIYDYITNIDITNDTDTIIEDRQFVVNLANGVQAWDTYYDSLIIRVKYIDKVSFTIITSNPVVITKEMYKYIIQDGDYRLNLTDFQLNDMNPENFNFIDKINCVIKKSEASQGETLQNSKTVSKVIYKPIFYKVKELQEIKLKSGITQNIGLNLGEMISKVDTFKIQIGTKEFPETARNDGYVIFKINSLELSDASGMYNLLNQDNEFISDGTWYMY